MYVGKKPVWWIAFPFAYCCLNELNILALWRCQVTHLSGLGILLFSSFLSDSLYSHKMDILGYNSKDFCGFLMVIRDCFTTTWPDSRKLSPWHCVLDGDFSDVVAVVINYVWWPSINSQTVSAGGRYIQYKVNGVLILQFRSQSDFFECFFVGSLILTKAALIWSKIL